MHTLLPRLLLGASLGLSAVAPALLPTAAEAATVTKVAEFAGGTESGYPYAGALIPAGGGLFYGTTIYGGSEDYGSLYSFNATTGAISTLFSFGVGNFGYYPYAGLTAAGGGIYYGTTSSGGTGGYGAIYKFDAGSGQVTEAASCLGGGAGSCDTLYAGLAAGPANGKFYGVSYDGGAGGYGNIFEFDPVAGSITQKAACNGSICENLYATLTWDATRNLFFGVSTAGGADGIGSIYSFDPANDVLQLRASCAEIPGDIYNCYDPYASLTLASDGLFYGTSYYGGVEDDGTIFSFNPDTNAISLLASFDAAVDGENPYFGSLVEGADGLLYGTTYYGGTGTPALGALFSFNRVDNSINLIASFDGADGEYPIAGLASAGGGVFYGTTYRGGDENAGTIFELRTGSSPDPEAVPGPLPLMGAAAAFRWSRRLRRRTRLARG